MSEHPQKVSVGNGLEAICKPGSVESLLKPKRIKAANNGEKRTGFGGQVDGTKRRVNAVKAIGQRLNSTYHNSRNAANHEAGAGHVKTTAARHQDVGESLPHSATLLTVSHGQLLLKLEVENLVRKCVQSGC